MNRLRFIPLATLLVVTIGQAEEVKLKLSFSSREISACSPVATHLKVTNEDFDVIRFTEPLYPEAGRIQFYARHDDAKDFRSIPGALYYDNVVGSGGEIKKGESRDIYTFLLSHEQDSFFDKTGVWYIQAEVIIGDVRGKSEPVKLLVKAGKAEPGKLLKLNDLLCESLGSKAAFNSKFLGRILESPIVGDELRTVTTWVDAISRVTEGPDEGLPERYKAACAIQSRLDKTSQALMAKYFARRLVYRGQGELAKEQARKLDAFSRAEIQYSIDERERNILDKLRPREEN